MVGKTGKVLLLEETKFVYSTWRIPCFYVFLLFKMDLEFGRKPIGCGGYYFLCSISFVLFLLLGFVLKIIIHDGVIIFNNNLNFHFQPDLTDFVSRK